jgi:hypothetical protein
LFRFTNRTFSDMYSCTPVYLCQASIGEIQYEQRIPLKDSHDHSRLGKGY